MQKESSQHAGSKTDLTSKLLSGAIAGIIGTSVIFPIDMVKTRLQSQNSANPVYRNGFDCMKKLFRAEGLRGFYRGLPANLIGVTPEKAIKLAVNDFARESFALRIGASDGSRIPLMYEVLAGATAGLCQVIATNPMEITKIQLQMESMGSDAAKKASSTWEVVRRLGITGLYRGTPATLLRDVPFSVIYFPTFANLKNGLGEDFRLVLLSGLIAGCVAAFSVTPMDVVKTRLQNLKPGARQYKNLIDCYRTIYKEEGMRAFFRGSLQRCMIVAPLFGITQLVYEVQQTYFRSRGQ
jgi:hypothetical protein